MIANEVSTKNLLIVDDTPTDIISAYHLSFNLGFTTTICFDGYDGLEHLHKNHYDLIILDLSMPILSGIDFLQRVGADEILRKKTHNIIIHSGFSDLSWEIYLPKNVILKDTWLKPLGTLQILKRLKEINLHGTK